MKILERAYLTCSGCKWLTSLTADDREGTVRGPAPACVRVFSGLLRMSPSGSWLLGRTKYCCRQSQYKFWTSFGDNKFGREVQSIQADNWDFGKDVYSDMFGAWFLRRGFCLKRRCNLSPTDLRAVPFLCNITDVTSEPRWLYSHVGLGCNLNNWTD